LNVTIPPPGICACNAAWVQELAVPLPTIPAMAVVERNSEPMRAIVEKRFKLELLTVSF